MSKILTLLLAALLIISGNAWGFPSLDKATQNAKTKTTEFVKTIGLTPAQESAVYKILLAKEQKNVALKQIHKGNKKSFKIAIKPFNKQFNRRIKDLIGKDNMTLMNQYFKAKKSEKK
ncbi:hypothetical protein ACMAZF_12400 [Psychrobium sp. nBUS_13]|uniref:hypothetical protein n=1 Tax=Psychrobium sp. nBUS_13 TaxID=3395319 RepID=UPI003EBE2C0C